MREARDKRVAALNPIFVALMFLVIVAIGACGVYALLLSQASADAAASGDDRTGEVRRMTSALDLEQAALLAETSDRGADRKVQFLEAGRAFDTAFREFRRDAQADQMPFANAVGPLHAAFVLDGRAAVAAIMLGDDRGARTIETAQAWPKLAEIRTELDAIASGSVLANDRGDALVREGTRQLIKLIAGVTLFGLVLMSGIAALLARYQRGATTASEEKLVLEKAALTDNLTSLGNHRAFSEDFAREISRAKRNQHPLVLALIDIDDFKAVNDSRGHAHGDDVLARVGNLLRSMRHEDRAYRVGGDEFALLLVETDAAAAKITLARLRDEARPALFGATLSIGYVNLSTAQLDQEPYELADTALYEAKRRGRDTTVCFDEIAESVERLFAAQGRARQTAHRRRARSASRSSRSGISAARVRWRSRRWHVRRPSSICRARRKPSTSPSGSAKSTSSTSSVSAKHSTRYRTSRRARRFS